MILALLEDKVKDKLLSRLLSQIITNSNTKILETYVSSTSGVPQGGCLSPWIFNMVIDVAVSEAKRNVKGLDKIIMYADDIVCCGDFKLEEFASILKKYGFIINDKKSASFRKKQIGISLRKTYLYLGTKLNDRGLAVGKTKVIKQTKARAKQISRIGKKNPEKGLLLLFSLCGGLVHFHSKRLALPLNAGTLVKGALGLNGGLNNEVAANLALSTLKKPKEQRSTYADSIIALCRLNGVVDINGRRTIIRWNQWMKSEAHNRRTYEKIKKNLPAASKNNQKKKSKRKKKSQKKKNPQVKKEPKTMKNTEKKEKKPKTSKPKSNQPSKQILKPNLEKKN